MAITLNKDFMLRETKKLLCVLLKLPEVSEVSIKGIIISSINDDFAINIALEKCYYDKYSDVDIEINIRLCNEQYFANTPIYTNCLGRINLENGILGMLYYSTLERGEVIRVCKTNGMRFDLIIKATCDNDRFTLPQDHINKSSKKVNEFWFIAVQALGKLMRGDYLISSHLTHKLVQESLILQMQLRDSQKGTTFHKLGYKEELNYLRVFQDQNTPFAKTEDDTYNYIASLLFSAVKSYDNLYSFLNNTYKSRIENFFEIWSCYCKDTL